MFPGEYRTQSNSLIRILNPVSLTVSRGFDAPTISTFFQFKYFASYDEYQFFLLFLPFFFPSSFIITAFNTIAVLISLRLKQLGKKLLPSVFKEFSGNHRFCPASTFLSFHFFHSPRHLSLVRG